MKSVHPLGVCGHCSNDHPMGLFRWDMRGIHLPLQWAVLLSLRHCTAVFQGAMLCSSSTASQRASWKFKRYPCSFLPSASHFLLNPKCLFEWAYITQALCCLLAAPNRLMSKQQKSCCAAWVCPPFNGMNCSASFKISPFVAATKHVLEFKLCKVPSICLWPPAHSPPGLRSL